MSKDEFHCFDGIDQYFTAAILKGFWSSNLPEDGYIRTLPNDVHLRISLSLMKTLPKDDLLRNLPKYSHKAEYCCYFHARKELPASDSASLHYPKIPVVQNCCSETS